MAGRFVIEMKAAGLAADLIKVFLVTLGFLRWYGSRIFRRLWKSLIRRTQRVGPESMFDIGNKQFLVLLLMMETQFNNLQLAFMKFATAEQLVDVLIYIAAVRLHHGQLGPETCNAN